MNDLLCDCGPRDRQLYLGRLWDALWFVLDSARRDEPPYGTTGSLLGRAVMGGRVVNPAFSRTEEDRPTRYLDPAEVRDAAAALAAVTEADLRAAYDPDAMGRDPDLNRQVYWWPYYARPDGFGQIKEGVERLRSFYRTAAEAGDAVLVVM